jgi:hypothetical protein
LDYEAGPYTDSQEHVIAFDKDLGKCVPKVGFTQNNLVFTTHAPNTGTVFPDIRLKEKPVFGYRDQVQLLFC